MLPCPCPVQIQIHIRRCHGQQRGDACAYVDTWTHGVHVCDVWTREGLPWSNLTHSIQPPRCPLTKVGLRQSVPGARSTKQNNRVACTNCFETSAEKYDIIIPVQIMNDKYFSYIWTYIPGGSPKPSFAVLGNPSWPGRGT